jgi:catechol 2,3-dioxygenase-like lactoylglutathione lyase family enzyme
VDVTLQIEVFPTDLERCVDFYTRVLRFDVVEDKRADRHPYVGFRRGSAMIGATPAWEQTDAPTRAVPQGAELVLEVGRRRQRTRPHHRVRLAARFGHPAAAMGS